MYNHIDRMKRITVYISLLSLLIVGCKKASLPTIDEILQSNPLLETVLQKYESDSLKRKAAEFLIENLPYYYSYEGESMKYYQKLYQLFGTGLYTLEEAQDSVRSLYGATALNQLTPTSDMDISPDYLIDNIEWAFRVWKEQPWGKNVSFTDFCEYILPYRIKDEPLKPWREKIYKKFNPLLDSIRGLPEATDPLFAARVLLDSVSKIPFYFSSSLGYGPHIGPDLVEWSSGNCRESADMLIYIFRAVGIPCGCDYMPLRGDANVAHFWNFMLDKYGDSYYMYKDKMPEPVRDYWGIRSKIYRQTFSLNRDMTEKIKGNIEEVYPTFRYPTFLDVTHLYSGKNARTLAIPRDKLLQDISDDEIIYLCGASQMQWTPLAYAYPTGDDIIFDDVEGMVVFQLAIYKSNELIPVSEPFEFNKDTGGIHYFHGSEEPEEVKLLNKYHQFIESFPRRMVGGTFEGSNHADFIPSDTLFIIKDYPLRLHNVIRLNHTKSYRYYRYFGPKYGYCNISEVSYYLDQQDTCKLEGRLLGTSNGKEGDAEHDYSNVHDGDPYTSFNYYLPTGGWAGLDFGKPLCVKKIIFTPRNRDNYVRKGDRYELFYSSAGKWISVGTQIAASDSLLYTVPKGALLYLKNHTRGKDERIFELRDGIQQYW